MSMSCWFSVCENKKTKHTINAMFFGEIEVFDYKDVCNHAFDTYDEAISYIYEHKLSFKNVHVRRTTDFGGGCYHKDYIYRIGRK